MPPAVVGAALEVFKMIGKDSTLALKTQANTRRFRAKMAANGFALLGDPAHAICPIMLGDARVATQFAEQMLLVRITLVLILDTPC